MAAAVVNHLRFRDPPDPELFARAQREVVPAAEAVEGFLGMHIVQASPDHYVLVVLGEDSAVLDRVATEVGSPWMSAHVVPLLASPPERHLGQIVATSGI